MNIILVGILVVQLLTLIIVFYGTEFTIRTWRLPVIGRFFRSKSQREQE